MEFKGKVALITGSSSGIGEGIAIKFASLGANVVITGRDENKIKEVVTKCEQLSKQKALGIRADLLDEMNIKNLVENTIKEFGKVDILVNNAGIYGNHPFGSEGYIQSYDKIMNTNVRSIQILTLLVVPYLQKTKGNIINISSVAGLRPNPGSVIYCMSKSALDMFTKCLALDLGPKGVRVNSVNPAAIRTPIFERFGGMGEGALQMIEQYCRQNYPLQRIGEPEDVAEMVAYLASDRASFITGALIPVDGGSYRSATGRLTQIKDK